MLLRYIYSNDERTEVEFQKTKHLFFILVMTHVTEIEQTMGMSINHFASSSQ